jgi:glycosyltransferase involved in cell wall biosynthesis
MERAAPTSDQRFGWFLQRHPRTFDVSSASLVATLAPIAPSAGPSVSVAICTRDRPADLRRAIESVLRDSPGQHCSLTEIFIVDDGHVDEGLLAGLRAAAEQRGWRFRYLNKSERGGLQRSRIEAISSTDSDIVVFIDDDVEVEPGYIAGVAATFASDARVAGVSGIDLLYKPTPLWRRPWEYAIGIRAFDKGRLSMSGFGHGIERWTKVDRPFETQFLVGFNMAYRRSALLEAEALDWFSSYSVAEDTYLSLVASRHGKLLADPRLRVRHHQSPAARDTRESVAFSLLVNPYRLQLMRGAALHRRLSTLVTGLGFLATGTARWTIDLIRDRKVPDAGRLRGLLRGMRYVIANELGRPDWKANS